MKIIGHRGARGTELENSLASIRAALQLDVDAIEFDIHRTKDNELVIMHDATTKRTSGQDLRIRDVTLADLQQVRLSNAEPIPLLKDVLPLVKGKDIYIDIKDGGIMPLLANLLHHHTGLDVTIVSRLTVELAEAHQLLPEVPTYLYFLKAEHPFPRPIHMVSLARQCASGLALDKLFLNPLTYHLARRQGLELYAYPIGSLVFAKLLRRLYPALDIATSHPEKINRRTLL